MTPPSGPATLSGPALRLAIPGGGVALRLLRRFPRAPSEPRLASSMARA